MDQRNPGLGAVARQGRRPLGVGPRGGLGIGLGAVHRGIGGGVDHQRRRQPRQQRGQLVRPVEIEFRPPGPHQVPPAGQRHDGGGELAAAAGDQDGAAPGSNLGHSVYHGSHAASRGRAASLSDSTASPGATGQGSARSGSFQITPRSQSLFQTSVTL